MPKTLKRNIRNTRNTGGRRRRKRTIKRRYKKRSRVRRRSRTKRRKRRKRTKRKRGRKVRKYIKKKDMIQTGGFNLRKFLPQGITSSWDSGVHKFSSFKNGISGKRPPMDPSVLKPHDAYYDQKIDPKPSDVQSAMNKGVSKAISSYNSSS